MGREGERATHMRDVSVCHCQGPGCLQLPGPAIRDLELYVYWCLPSINHTTPPMSGAVPVSQTGNVQVTGAALHKPVAVDTDTPVRVPLCAA